MKTSVWVMVGVGVVVLLGGSLLAQRLGGISIRTLDPDTAGITLNVTEPVVLGVPTRVRWTEALLNNSPVTVLVRTQTEERVLGHGLLHDRQMMVEFPCDIEGTASLVLVFSDTRELISHSVVDWQYTPAECIL